MDEAKPILLRISGVAYSSRMSQHMPRYVNLLTVSTWCPASHIEFNYITGASASSSTAQKSCQHSEEKNKNINIHFDSHFTRRIA